MGNATMNAAQIAIVRVVGGHLNLNFESIREPGLHSLAVTVDTLNRRIAGTCATANLMSINVSNGLRQQSVKTASIHALVVAIHRSILG